MNPNRYITNWGDYGMPEEIKVELLKNILEQTASYKRIEQCPFGSNYEDCVKETMKSVITKMIHDVLEKNIEINSDSVGRTAYTSDFDEPEDIYIDVVETTKNIDTQSKVRTGEFSCLCERKNLSYNGRYGYFKVNNSHKRNPYNTNKPFGKVFIRS